MQLETIDTKTNTVNDLVSIKLTPIEHKIVEYAASGRTPKSIATTLGIPTTTVNRLLAKKEVKELMDGIIEARNRALLNYLPNMLAEILEAKIQRAKDDPDSTLADASKRDVVDIAKTISDIIKGSSTAEKPEASGVVNFYQTLGFVAGQDKPTIDVGGM